jgi:hypothetical protein
MPSKIVVNTAIHNVVRMGIEAKLVAEATATAQQYLPPYRIFFGDDEHARRWGKLLGGGEEKKGAREKEGTKGEEERKGQQGQKGQKVKGQKGEQKVKGQKGEKEDKGQKGEKVKGQKGEKAKGVSHGPPPQSIFQGDASTVASRIFSATLHSADVGAKLVEPFCLHGTTDLTPWLSDAAAAGLAGNRVITFRVLVDGNNAVYLGVMRNHPAEGVDLERGVFYNEAAGNNENLWCFCLNNRKTYSAGKRVVEGRTAGPGTFETPLTLDIAVDASAGTVAVVVVSGKGKEWDNQTKQYGEIKDWSGHDLGVVVRGVQTGAPLHLAVGTHDDRCKVTLLALQ